MPVDSRVNIEMDPEFLRSVAFDVRHDQELLGIAIQVCFLTGVRWCSLTLAIQSRFLVELAPMTASNVRRPQQQILAASFPSSTQLDVLAGYGLQIG